MATKKKTARKRARTATKKKASLRRNKSPAMKKKPTSASRAIKRSASRPAKSDLSRVRRTLTSQQPALANGDGAPAKSVHAAPAGGGPPIPMLAHTKHKKMRIGCSKNLKITADGSTPNTFRVYGESIGVPNPNKVVKEPKGKHHTFTFVGTPGLSDIDDNTIEITATAARSWALFAGGMDDLTITI